MKQTMAWAPTAPGTSGVASIKMQFPRGQQPLGQGPCTAARDAASQSWVLSCLPGPFPTPRGLSQGRKRSDTGVSVTKQAQDKRQGQQDPRSHAIS